jgi:hypothetical protein
LELGYQNRNIFLRPDLHPSQSKKDQDIEVNRNIKMIDSLKVGGFRVRLFKKWADPKNELKK